MPTHRPARAARPLAAALALLAVAGCGGHGPKVYPVRGKVVLTDGDVKLLEESYVELAMDGNPGARVDGTIGPDGKFDLQITQAGNILKGAEAGTYRARIVLAEDGSRETIRKRQAAVHPRFRDFAKSGLTVQVPTGGEVTLTVSAK
jgi:hypothetical protein